MAIRTIIADDHAIFRSGLRVLLEQEADIEVVAETENGFETIRAVAERQIDVLLLDLSMPGLAGEGCRDGIAGQTTPCGGHSDDA